MLGKKKTQSYILKLFTFKEIHGVRVAAPHVHVGIHTGRRESVPPNLHGHGISVTGSVAAVLIEPVPAVTHEVGAKAHDHFTVRRSLLPDPIKRGAEATPAPS